MRKKPETSTIITAMTSQNGLPEPAIIEKPGDLKRLAGILSHESIVAVDTESNSLHAYREQVCLIQFSTTQEDFLVDPLALRDLSPLGPIFAHPEIEKVFHAAEYDLICLRRDFGFKFNNLFDTMVAASILGRNEVGLGSMLENEFGIQLDKRFQRAEWGERPLPAHLLNYARYDTHYLIQLRDRLKAELEAEDRWPLALEDFERMCIISERYPENTGRGGKGPANETVENCWRISGVHDLTPQQAAVLHELCKYRDQVARNLNRPLFKVISDATLVAIAASLPTNYDELRRLPGMSKGQVQRHGYALLQAIQRGLVAPPLYSPRSPRPDDAFLNRLENLRKWRKLTAIELGVKSDVVLSRDLLYQIAERNPRDLDGLGPIMKDVPWRLEHFGDQILKVIEE